MISILRISTARVNHRSNRRCLEASLRNMQVQIEMGGQHYCPRLCHSFLQNLDNYVFKRRQSFPLGFSKRRQHSTSINTRYSRKIRYSMAASSSSPLSSFIFSGDNRHNTASYASQGTTTSSFSSVVSRSNVTGDEKFSVMKINTETGAIRRIQMCQSEIMVQTTLSPRDLVSLRLTSKKERRENRVGKSLVEQMRHPPTIMARNKFILLSMGPVRAVAEPDAVYVFDVHSKAAKLFATDLAKVYEERSEAIKNKTLLNHEEPTELVFLETVLTDAVDSFTGRIRIFEPIVNDLLLRISLDVEDVSNTNTIHQMAPLKEQLQSFEIFVTQAYDCVTQLLNDDEAMLQLLLTEQEEARRTNTTVDFERHQHVEHILGIYARRFSSVIQEVNYLLGRIESRQEYIELELDLYRNRLIRMNVDLAILATATGVTTALSGTFGMNMVNGFEESHTAFLVTSATSALAALSVGHFFRRMVSGNVIQQRAQERIGEIRTMSNALSDMSALDYAVKQMIRGENMNKTEFKEQLAGARHSKTCTDEEVDLLFRVLNTHKDDVLDKEDFVEKRDSGESP